MFIKMNSDFVSNLIAFGALLISIISILWQWYETTFKKKVYISVASIGLNESGPSGKHQFYIYVTTNTDVPYIIDYLYSENYFNYRLSDAFFLTNETPLFFKIDSDALHEEMLSSCVVKFKVYYRVFNKGIKLKYRRCKITGFDMSKIKTFRFEN